MPNYLDHCEWSFSRYGVRASSWLSTEEHFKKWEERYFNSFTSNGRWHKAWPKLSKINLAQALTPEANMEVTANSPEAKKVLEKESQNRKKRALEALTCACYLACCVAGRARGRLEEVSHGAV